MIEQEIMKIMNDIEYGFKDEYGNNISVTNPEKWDDEFYNFYYLQTPDELLESRCGVCFDQVELERNLFEKNNINVNTYNFDKSICVNHEGYLGLCMGSNDTAPRIEASGPGSASFSLAPIREFKPFEAAYSITDVSVYYRYIYASFTKFDASISNLI